MRKNNSRKKLKSDEIYGETVKILIKAGYKDNWVHGLPHIERLRKNFRLLLQYGKIDLTIAKCLKIAVDTHDMGRAFPGNHAENSVKILKKMDIEGLTEKEKNDIEFALKYHNKGLPALEIARPKENKEILLGLLCALDHMDGIGKIGILRAYQWTIETEKDPQILSKCPLATLKKYAKKKHPVPQKERLFLRDGSVLGGLIYDYLATFEIVAPVKRFLGKKIIKIIEARNNEVLKEINCLIKLVEKNQKVD